MSFNYSKATLQDTVEHIKIASVQSVSAALSYYKKANNSEIVEKIVSARKIIKAEKLQHSLNTINKEISHYGNII